MTAAPMIAPSDPDAAEAARVPDNIRRSRALTLVPNIPPEVRRANAYRFAQEMARDLGIPPRHVEQWALASFFEGRV